MRFWRRFQQTHWRAVVQDGLVPITIGLILASGYVLTREADHTAVAYGLTAFTAALVIKTRIHPLWLLGIAGVLGATGVV